MKKTRYTEEQIAFALKQAETGTRVEEVCRKMGISEAKLEEEIWRHGRDGTAPPAPAGGREPPPEAPGRRPQPGQGDAAGRHPKKVLRPVQKRWSICWRHTASGFAGDAG